MNKQQAESAASQVMREKPVTGAKRPTRLRRELCGNLRRMKRLYLQQLAMPQKKPVALWLCDNFYVLEKESKQTSKELKCPEKLPASANQVQLYLVCRQVLALCIPLEEAVDGLVRGMQQFRDLTVAEFAFLPLALKAALIDLACAACVENGGEHTISYAITALTQLYALDFDSLTCKYSIVEALFQRDPSGIYHDMQKQSKGYYRMLLGKIAQKTGVAERLAAEQTLSLAASGSDTRTCHVGYYLLNSPVLGKENRLRGLVYLLGCPCVALVLALAAGLWCKSVTVGILSLLPLWEAVRPLIQRVAMYRACVAHIPRMNAAHSKTAAAHTVVAVSVLMPAAGDAAKAARHLEEIYWKNAEDDLSFCLLADFKESDRPVNPEDDGMLKALTNEITVLNARYGNRFLLFVRGRTYNKTQGRFSGWERKRGAITEFIRYAKGDVTSVRAFVGDKSRLSGMRWLLALDADTDLLFDTAGKMVSAAAHPLNHAVVDSTRGVVTQGYGVFVPRMSTTIESQSKTPFSRIMAGIGGITPYDEAAGDLYQDIFQEAIFSGKGLLDADCFYHLLNARLPENLILSHDILEGAFLRTALLSDVELADSFPSGALSWLARLHRWIRGDWQNIGFVADKKVKIGWLNRVKLLDNLRRSLTPVLALACVLSALVLPYRAAAILFWAALLCVSGAPLLEAAFGVAASGVQVFSRKFFTKVVPQAIEQLAAGLFALVLLPQTALRALDAMVRALYRRLISHKNLLQWVTAADSEKNSQWLAAARQCWLAELIGLVVLFASPYAFLHFYGLLFAAVIPFVAYTGAYKPPRKKQLEIADQERLVRYCAAMWRFFENFATKEEHYLPPDNIQQSPVYAVAHRTSPTNIGLLLLATLAAHDLGFIQTAELLARISNTLDTLELLPKWRGNLYNWYNTTTLALLEPRFVSSVDSGNFVCCLVALWGGLAELTQTPKLVRLTGRIDQLIAGTDIGVFYNKQRSLLSIGYNESSGEMMDNYYDFLMSEARMAGYYAVASHQVDKRHWGMLGRAMSQTNAYAGPVSWTGTMFEYYMPHLLLPVYDGSLLSESLAYCLYCQKRRVHGEKTPWGISESAFYLFDGQLNYQYKAHGVQKLGVKRGLDRELVISPYSSFLTLPFYPGASMKNLRRMEQMGFTSTYGFYEAIDFTKPRVSAEYGVCRSFMSHHIGMSMVAASNALFDMSMQKRFLRDNRMNAARELLQEKVCRNTVVYDNIKFKDVKEREPVRTVIAEEYSQINPQKPQVLLLGNGAFSDILTDTGAGWCSYSGVDVTRRPTDLLQNACGNYAFLDDGTGAFSLTAAPVYNAEVNYRVRFLANGMLYKAKRGQIKTGMRVLVHQTLACEQREYQIKNLSQKSIGATLLLYFEPTLATPADYAAHPAFSKLFVTAHYDEKSRILVFTRRERANANQLYFATGFLEEVGFEYETKRENLMQSPDGLAGLLGFAARNFTGGTGTPDAACAIRLSFAVPAGGRVKLTQFFSAGQSAEEATSNITKLRAQGGVTVEQAPASPLVDATIEGRLAFSLLPKLLFAAKDSAENDSARAANTLGKNSLWKLAISGDRPIVLYPAQSGCNRERAAAYLSLYHKAKLAGCQFDLVFTMGELGETAQFLTGYAAQIGCADQIGAGVYLIPLAQYSTEVHTLLQAAAVHIAPSEGAPVPLTFADYTPMPIKPVLPTAQCKMPELTVAGGVFAGGRFYVARGKTAQGAGETSPLPYSHILANAAFGTLLGDNTLGFTWAVNARENKLTPWSNDIARGNSGELLLLRTSHCYNLLDGARCSFCQTDARYECHAGEMSAAVTVTVPERGCVKYVAVTLTNKTNTRQCGTLAYYTEPVLGVDRADARQLQATVSGRGVTVHNPFQTAVPGVLHLCSGGTAPVRCVCSRADFFCGRWDSSTQNTGDFCAALLVDWSLDAGQSATVTFQLIWAATAQAAEILSKIDLPPAKPLQSVVVTTPDEALNQLINHFLPHQILACRVWGRTAFYQCGGAYGFRDQLQDVCACLLAHPSTARRQILRAAAAQFPQGDVLHWWHSLPCGLIRGVRTKYSDDLLWLPYAVCEYIQTTGDWDILRVQVPFVDGDELGTDEKERYFEPKRTVHRETLYEHCARAIDKAHHLGELGLPLIGCGDWNDGFNGVGSCGKGQSVWLAMFLSLVLERFCPLALAQGDETRAQLYRQRSAALKAAVDEHCWDGAWYLRAFYDDGAPMGGSSSKECRIDSLPQSFAALCHMPDTARVSTALTSALFHLADEELRVVKLFDKPFVVTPRQPGYVKAYPAGVRENGGQYTHAAVWLALALLHQGKAEEGWRLLCWLNPASRCGNEALAPSYRLEPYYIAADIYTNEGARGRGGWSMYTGASSWYYKTVVEHLLGVRVAGCELRLAPCIPPHWPGFALTLLLQGTPVHVAVARGENCGLTVDGVTATHIALDGETHDVVLVLPKK